MEVFVIDRSRTTRIAPTKMRDNPFDTMRELLRGHPVKDGQIVLQCDAEFFTALTGHTSEADFVPAEHSGRTEPGMPGQLPTPVPTFGGAPIIVMDEPYAFRAAPAEPQRITAPVTVEPGPVAPTPSIFEPEPYTTKDA